MAQACFACVYKEQTDDSGIANSEIGCKSIIKKTTPALVINEFENYCSVVENSAIWIKIHRKKIAPLRHYASTSA